MTTHTIPDVPLNAPQTWNVGVQIQEPIHRPCFLPPSAVLTIRLSFHRRLPIFLAAKESPDTPGYYAVPYECVSDNLPTQATLGWSVEGVFLESTGGQ